VPLTDTQLRDIIEQFRLALDKRPPDSMCQVSPRAMAVALAHFEELQRDRQLPDA
jgi:hypothetical protein